MLSLVITYVEEVFNFFNLGGCSVQQALAPRARPRVQSRLPRPRSCAPYHPRTLRQYPLQRSPWRPRQCRPRWQRQLRRPKPRRSFHHGEQQQQPKQRRLPVTSSRCPSPRPRSHPTCTTSGGTAWPPCGGRARRRRPKCCPSKVAARCGWVDCLRTGQHQPFHPSLFKWHACLRSLRSGVAFACRERPCVSSLSPTLIGETSNGATCFRSCAIRCGEVRMCSSTALVAGIARRVPRV